MGIINYIKAIKTINKIEYDIIIFSEGSMYNNTNEPLVNELIKYCKILYISIDKSDKLFKIKDENFNYIFIKFDIWGRLFLAMIKGNLFITTTPGLNNVSFKKSYNIKHYSYYMHAPVDIHNYQKNSFDHFDSVICTGEYQKKTLEYLENKRNTHKKELEVLGLIYYDNYYKNKKINNKNKVVLIAPSWGENNFLNYIDYDLFETILEQGYSIIYRPHNMSIRYEQKQINTILNKYKNNKMFKYDVNETAFSSMTESSILISAISGIILDYFLFFSSKIIIIDIPKHNNENLEIKDIDYRPWENNVFNDIGIKVRKKQELIDAINNHKDINDKVEKYRKEIHSLGSATHNITKYYTSKLKSI
ncbi:hypothetical protein [Brachyspira sp.]|uniref:hypothetical protein n=1 Tax=Brachyspira sp. TaxID=1977261 RepID=UPI002605AA56|nr:hypothetical protein [Brachyspira sp.]